MPLDVVFPFDFPLNPPTNDIHYVGRIDAVATRTDDSGIYLIDNKSTGRLDSSFTRQFSLSTQMSVAL